MSDALAALLARERRRLVALLARHLGLAHLALAEDAVQQACLQAVQTWPRDGEPANPAAWLYRVAQRAAIDQLRLDRHRADWPEDEAELPLLAPLQGRMAGELDDDELALLFAACHPALPAASQVLLALRVLGGFELAALAPLFFSTEAALAQRLARARRELAGCDLALPAGAELPPRREAVLTALALGFHQGQQAAARGTGSEALQVCWEAIRLARALAAHPATAAAEADALAALLLLHGARLTGRSDAAGDIVPLPGQARDRWDGGLIRLGFAHLSASQRGTCLSRWHLLAGIAAEHARAPQYDATDWAAIVGYYEALLPLDPSAAPRLGHAIALAEAGAPQAALVRLRAMQGDVPAALRAHHAAAQSRAAERLGDWALARSALREAIAAAPHPAEAQRLQRRLDAMPAPGIAGA
jgi:RNA polymerase sigma-70 factor, ECF subfamily